VILPLPAPESLITKGNRQQNAVLKNYIAKYQLDSVVSNDVVRKKQGQGEKKPGRWFIFLKICILPLPAFHAGR
jgi:hypothetical protein